MCTSVRSYVCVCVFSNPCQSWHILQRQTEIGCSRSRRRFLYGICMVCTHTHPDTEVHRGTQSHRQWKGALAQAVANWLHCRIERVLIANDLHLTETLKVLPIEDLLDKPKQTRTKLPPKRMDWWDPLFLFLSLFLSKKWMYSSTRWLCHKLSTFSISRSVNQLIFKQRTVNS